MDRQRWGLEVNGRDHLVFGGQDLVDLAAAYGTPLFVVDEYRLRGNYHRFRNAFREAYSEVTVCYSYKTNCVPGVLQVLHEEGCGAEVVSPYEVWLSSRLEVDSSRVVYNGVNKSLPDLEAAIRTGVGIVNVDSAHEARRLVIAAERSGMRVSCGVRVDPGVGWKAQFGLQPGTGQVLDVATTVGSSDLVDLNCLHVHIGTGLRDTRAYGRAIAVLTSLIKALKHEFDVGIAYLDLGGGFGVPTVKSLSTVEQAGYKLFSLPPRKPRVGSCPSIEAFGSAIGQRLSKCCAEKDIREPTLLLEPGRALTSDAQLLLVKIGEIKRRRDGTTFAIADGGMQNVAFPLSYEYHTCFLASRASARPRSKYFVVGPLCSPEDLLYRNWRLPELREGDILAIMDAGAYFISFSNTFSYPRPPVVMVSNDHTQLIRKRESFEHLIALDSF